MEDVIPGKQLGRLEIQEQLAVGASGKFYRALDSRSGQQVGVEILPLEHGSELRFQSKHHDAARLKHPSILGVQRLLSKPGISYLITDAIDGESLRNLIRKGGLPFRDVVRIGVQIADGLAAGHAAGFVHGHLTPENIVVSREGQARILNFGFPHPGPVEYTSPEQLRGEAPTPQSDVFSLGAILYEMVTGSKAFRGSTVQERTEAVLEAIPMEPPATVPAPLVDVIGRCLEKPPAARFASGAELSGALTSCADLIKPASGPRNERTRTVAIFQNLRHLPAALAALSERRTPVWVPLLLAAAVAALSIIVLFNPRRGSAPLARLEQISFRQGSILRGRFAGDSKTIVYTARFEGSPQASYVLSPASPEARELTLPPGALLLAVSAKQELLVRLMNGLLVRTPLWGGPAQQVATNVLDADWGPGGQELAVARRADGGGRFRVEYPAGNILYESDSPLEPIRISPAGDRVAFGVINGSGRELWVVGKSGKPQRLASLGKAEPLRTLSWSPNGREIWYGGTTPAERGSIQAVALNGSKRLVSWMPHAYLDDVAPDGKSLIENLRSWSGVLFSVPDQNLSQDLSWHGETINLELSPDGQRIISTEYGQTGAEYTIFSRVTDGSPATRLAKGEVIAISPDGRWVTAFRRDATPKYTLVSIDGDEKPVTIPGLEDKSAPVVGWRAGGEYVIWGRQPGQRARHFIWNPAAGRLTPITPEGTPIGYVAESGSRILARGPKGQPVVFTLDGNEPQPARGITPADHFLRWANDGRSVFMAVLEGDRNFVAYRVDLTTGNRSLWRKLDPQMPADTILPRAITPDGRSVAYIYYRSRAELFLADGLR